MDIFLKKATACMPLFREELLYEVINKKAYGNISQLWHFPGHIIVTTNDGRKLFTFDCIPISSQNSFDQRFLDIPNLPTPLLDCLMLSEELLALVDKHGSVKLWKFTESFVWQPWGELDLCQSNSAEVVSIDFVRSSHELVWCEKRQSPATFSSESTPAPQFCLCRKQLPASFKSNNLSNMGPCSILMHNCPSCDIHSVTNDVLLISSSYGRDKVSLYMMYDFTTDNMDLHVGNEFTTFEIKDGIDFQDAAMMCLSSLAKTEPGQGDCGVRTDDVEGHAAVLSSSGAVDIFTCLSGSGKKQLSKRRVQLSKCTIDPVEKTQPQWFLHKNLLGIASGNTISVYNLVNGRRLCATGLEKTFKAQCVVPSRSPTFLAWILTDEELYGVQGQDTSALEIFSTPDKLPNDQLLQTDILRLARLQQRKSEGYSLTLSDEIGELKNKWRSLGGLHQQSEVSQILAPYMEEYWRLDSLSKALLDSEKPQPMRVEAGDSPEAFVTSVMEERCIGRAPQHAKLLWLSQIYPQQLLDYLCLGISFESDTVDQTQLRQWQTLIGLDGGDLLHFEFVCRLLFHLDPAKLIQFVKISESVSEQAVGVSAFVRKKQSLMYYKAACECLPLCQSSKNPKLAASSKAKLILASMCDNCEERSLKCYLQHGLWPEALDMLREVAHSEAEKFKQSSAERDMETKSKEGDSSLPTLLYITVTALAQNQVLSEYATDLFELMPNWKSFMSFSKVATGRPEIRQQQLSSSSYDVFAVDKQNGVPLESVRSHLLDLIKKMNTTK